MQENSLPLVSIVACCLNSERYLPRMIESVLEQNYPQLELFIQDGGSRDGSLEIIQRYPVRWASEKDQGISQALNRAISASQGEIIGFTGSDDKLQPGAVSAAAEAFTVFPETVMVYGDCLLTNEDGIAYKYWKSRPLNMDRLFWENFIPFQTVYLYRQALLEVGGFDETMRMAQDYDLWVRLGAHYPAERFRYIPKVLGSYQMRFNSAGWSNLRDTALGHQKTARVFLENPSAVAKLKKGKAKAGAGACIMTAGLYALTKDKKSAWSFYFKALRQYPGLICTKHGVSVLLKMVIPQRAWRFYKKRQQHKRVVEIE